MSSPEPAAALQGACRDPPLPWQRAGKGLELLRSPPSSWASEEGWGLLLPARHRWHLPSPGMESAGISPKGTRSQSSHLQGAPCLCASTINLCLFLPSSSSSPQKARAGAATAAFVKHFKGAGPVLRRTGTSCLLPASQGVGSGSAGWAVPGVPPCRRPCSSVCYPRLLA